MTSSSSSPPSSSTRRRRRVEYFLILAGIAKNRNVGTVIRSASAMRCSGVIYTSEGQWRAIQTFGAHGSDERMRFYEAKNTKSAVAFARNELRCTKVIGVEIKDEAAPIAEFARRECETEEGDVAVAFMFGEEGHGMNAKQCELCDGFVYVPHFSGGTASLNVAVCASIIFYEFAKAAEFPEQRREGEKFVVVGNDVGDAMNKRGNRRPHVVQIDDDKNVATQDNDADQLEGLALLDGDEEDGER